MATKKKGTKTEESTKAAKTTAIPVKTGVKAGSSREPWFRGTEVG